MGWWENQAILNQEAFERERKRGTRAMQDRTKDIRAAVALVAEDIRRDEEEAAKGPLPETITAVEFLLGNLLCDIHAIARAQSHMAGPPKGKE